MGKPVRRFFCVQRDVVKRDALKRGRQNAVPFTVPAPGHGTCPVPGGPVGRRPCGAALRSRSTAFSSSRMAFMSMVSTCFWAVSRSISRCFLLFTAASRRQWRGRHLQTRPCWRLLIRWMVPLQVWSSVRNTYATSCHPYERNTSPNPR